MISLAEGPEGQRPIHDRDEWESMPEGHAMQKRGGRLKIRYAGLRIALMPLGVILQAELHDALNELLISNVHTLGGLGKVLAE